MLLTKKKKKKNAKGTMKCSPFLFYLPSLKFSISFFLPLSAPVHAILSNVLNGLKVICRI